MIKASLEDDDDDDRDDEDDEVRRCLNLDVHADARRTLSAATSTRQSSRRKSPRARSRSPRRRTRRSPRLARISSGTTKTTTRLIADNCMFHSASSV